jgi:hypothetical protein
MPLGRPTLRKSWVSNHRLAQSALLIDFTMSTVESQRRPCPVVVAGGRRAPFRRTIQNTAALPNSPLQRTPVCMVKFSVDLVLSQSLALQRSWRSPIRDRRCLGPHSRGHWLFHHRRGRPKGWPLGPVIIAMVIAIAGGRPAMISAATAATAVLFAPSSENMALNTSWRPPF